MFCLLPTLWKQQQIAILIISFFLYVNGIRNEGNNMLQQQQLKQQQQHQHQRQQQQLELQLEPLHATIKNSNYQRSSSSSNSVFKPSPLLEFTLADVTMSQSNKPTYDEPKYPSSLTATSKITQGAPTNIEQVARETLTTKTKDQHDNRRYSNGETKFLFPNEQQQVYPIPQQQQHQQEQELQYQYEQQQQQYQQQQQHQQYQQQQPPPQKYQPEQHFTEMPIYIYRDPYTNENYHYTPTEPTILEAGLQSSATYTSSHNDNAANGYKQQQPHQQQLQLYQPATQAQDNQEYLVHSSMTVGAQRPPHKHNPYLNSDKDVYLKRPGLVYDESYVAHPNAVVEKKRDGPQTMKTNKISYDSHDYPPPSYAQQQTSNFLPTPEPERPPTPKPTQLPPPVRRPPPSYATASPPYSPPRQDYRPRPPPPPPPPSPPHSQQASTFGRPQHQQQQYLQSSQNALPNYANNLDNYLSNKQQGPFYQTERPPSYLQQQHPHYENGPSSLPPSYRPPQQQHQQQSPYPGYESPQYHQHPSSHPSRPSYNNYYDYQIGEVPPQSQGALNYPYPRPPNGPYRPPPPPVQQPSGLASLVQYAPQFTSLLLGGGGGGGSSSNSNSPLGSLLGALTGAGNAPQTSSLSSTSFNRRPINAQLIRALENIARNDDLQCVPKVVCQMIAAQTQRGQLPSFVTSPAITNFLAGFPAASPALIYGRAALLGISGGDKICHQTYLKCPKNEVEIIYYLNNHRGGFFKFFSEPETQPTLTHQNQDSPQTSLFSILAALTGNEQVPPPTTPRPRPKPQPAASSDITSTIGNFFTNLLSDYMGEGATVEYQRRRRRRRRSAERRVRFVNSKEEDEDYDFNAYNEDYNDEEDSEDTQQSVAFTFQPEYLRDEEQAGSEIQSRVVHKPSEEDSRLKFFPGRDNIAEGSGRISQDIKSLIQRFNEFNRGRKLKFPTATTERQYINVANEFLKESKGLNEKEDEENYSQQYTNYKADTFEKLRDSKMVTFREDPASQTSSYHNLYLNELKDLSMEEPSHTVSQLTFPEREGKILNNYYASSYSYNHLQQNPRQESQNEFVVPNNQRPKEYHELYAPQENYIQRPPVNNEIKSPVAFYSQGPQDYNEATSPDGSHIYNNHVTSLNSINNYVSNSATSHNNYYGSPLNQDEFKPASPSNTYFLPTPASAADSNNDYSNSIQYPNNNLHANAVLNSQKYSTSVTNSYNSYGTLQNPPTSSVYTSGGNNNYNEESYNSYRPLRKPSYSSSSNSGSTANYNGGNYNSYRPQAYPASGSSSSLSTNNSYNSVNTQSYPSNTYSQTNRYHSSFYTTPRPAATTPSRNDNVYVTNGRGETEYYVTPDGRKIYL